MLSDAGRADTNSDLPLKILVSLTLPLRHAPDTLLKRAFRRYFASLRHRAAAVCLDSPTGCHKRKTERTYLRELTGRQIDTILAALRQRQVSLDMGNFPFKAIAENDGESIPLTSEEIDELCEYVNLGL